MHTKQQPPYKATTSDAFSKFTVNFLDENFSKTDKTKYEKVKNS